MARYRGTTTERGYGATHEAERKRLLFAWRPGDPCARCDQPMWDRWRYVYWQGTIKRVTAIDLGHDHVNGGYLGLEHHDCNRGEGARRGNQMRPFTKAAARAGHLRNGHIGACKACGQTYHRAARACEMCGAHYHPTYGEQRTCSRACGVQLVRRNRMARGWVPKAQRPKPPRKQRQPPEPYAPRSAVAYYTCRYCGRTGASPAKGQPREVCNSRSCQRTRLKANNMRIRHGVSKDDADAHMRAVVTRMPYVAESGLVAPARDYWHPCPGCGEFTAAYRWCDACLCSSVNAKGKRCGNASSVSGLCDYHASGDHPVGGPPRMDGAHGNSRWSP